MDPNLRPVLRVTRTKAQARQFYDAISWFYDLFGGFEQKYRNRALRRLNVTRGETVLEIGFGTGQCLQQIVEAVGEDGQVYGLDISPGMLEISRRRLEKAGLWQRVELTCADGTNLPYVDDKFDAVFSSFVLELFDTPELPRVLAEIRRVLRPAGRIGVISMAQGERVTLFQKLYACLHQNLPQFFDCRPIYVEDSLRDAGFIIAYQERVMLYGLPVDIIIGTKPAPSAHPDR